MSRKGVFHDFAVISQTIQMFGWCLRLLLLTMWLLTLKATYLEKIKHLMSGKE
jgi:hypothetical protein